MTRLLWRAALVCSLVSTVPSCTVLNDLDDFSEAQTCDFDFTLIAFDGPHGQNQGDREARQLFEFDLVRPPPIVDGVPAGVPLREGIIIFDPIPMGTLHLNVPNMIQAPPEFGDQAIDLHFFADRDRNGHDAPPIDHSWILQDACENIVEPYVHHTDFDDLSDDAELFGFGSDVALIACEEAAILGAFQTMEVHVSALDIDGSERPVGMLRRNASEPPTIPARPPLMRANAIAAAREEAEIHVPGVVSDSDPTVVRLLQDNDGDGVEDAGERVWEWNIDLPDTCPAFRNGCPPEPCMFRRDEFDIIVIPVFGEPEESTDGTNNFETWWSTE